MIEPLPDWLPVVPLSEIWNNDWRNILVMTWGGIAPGVVTSTVSMVRWLIHRWLRPFWLVGSWDAIKNGGRDGVVDFSQSAVLEKLESLMSLGWTCLWPGRWMLGKNDLYLMRAIMERWQFRGVGWTGGDGSLSGWMATQFSLWKDGKPVSNSAWCVKTIDLDTEGSLAIGWITSADANAEAIQDMIREIQWEKGVGIVNIYGRDNGQLALRASALAAGSNYPVITLLPEFPVEKELFLERVRCLKEQFGYVCIVASEWFAFQNESQVVDPGKRDGAGNAKLLGCASHIKDMISRDAVLNSSSHLSLRTLDPGITTRSCNPTSTDIALAKKSWDGVAELIHQEAWWHVVAVQWTFQDGFNLKPTPLSEISTGNPVLPEMYDSQNLSPSWLYRQSIMNQAPTFADIDMSGIDQSKAAHASLIRRILNGDLGELVEYNGVMIPSQAIQEDIDGRETPTVWTQPIRQMLTEK